MKIIQAKNGGSAQVRKGDNESDAEYTNQFIQAAINDKLPAVPLIYDDFSYDNKDVHRYWLWFDMMSLRGALHGKEHQHTRAALWQLLKSDAYTVIRDQWGGVKDIQPTETPEPTNTA